MEDNKFDVNDVDIVMPEANDAEIYGPLIMCLEHPKAGRTKGVMLSELVRKRHKYAYEVYGCRERWLVPFFDRERYRVHR